MAQVTELHSREDFDRLVQESYERPVALLKHSTACPLSAFGRSQFMRLEEETPLPLHVVVVQHARDVSNYVAEQTGVRHETPQALILAGGEVVYHASHHRIAADALQHAAGKAAEAQAGGAP